MTPHPRRLELSPRTERRVAALFLGLLLTAKMLYVFACRVDSDETQHLHVVWAWANGLLPYRDLFDNHSPLFQFLCSPLLRAFGERPDIVMAMRWVVIPLYFLCLWCVYRCGTIIFSRRLALWAAILTGAYPTFFTKSTEFRTDDLWAPLWLLSIMALVKRPLQPRSAFLAGLALGASFATSMKTSALAAAILMAAAVLLGQRMIRRSPVEWKRLLICLTALLAGMTILPAIVVASFAWKGALPNLYYGVIEHNLVPGLFRVDVSKRAGLLVIPIALAVVGGYFTVTRATGTASRNRLAFIALTSAALSLIFGFYWPIIEPHDLLPLVPLAFLSAVPALSELLKPDTGYSGRGLSTLVLPLVAGAEIIALVIVSPPRLHALDETTALISDVLTLTEKEEYVMDAKGEDVFRRRAFYHALEGVTLERIRLGLIEDNIPERLIATRAPVATILRTPPRARQFIEQNYIPVANQVRVLGQMLGRDDQEFGKSREFQIAIPEEYMLVAERGNLEAVLDGTPWQGPRYLSVGRHRVEASSGGGRVALVLARAIQKGFSPFSPKAKDVAKGDLY